MANKTVKSSFIRDVDYTGRKLTIRFKNGKILEYTKVPRDVAIDFVRARSKGRFYNANIRGVYTVERAF
jgi:hypothetical protein